MVNSVLFEERNTVRIKQSELIKARFVHCGPNPITNVSDVQTFLRAYSSVEIDCLSQTYRIRLDWRFL